MTIVKLRVPVRAAQFPLSVRKAGRTVFLPQLDVQPSKNSYPIPQPVYLRNMLPTPEGYNSTYYFNRCDNDGTFQLAPIDATSWAGLPVFVRDSRDNIAQIFFTAAGFDSSGAVAAINGTHSKAFIQNGNMSTPQQLSGSGEANTAMWPTDGTSVTTAFIKEISYVHLLNRQTYVYNPANAQLDIQELSGLDSSAIRGICAASGYLLAYDEDTIYYSSLADTTDFNPSVMTGAGSSKILELKGPIVVCHPIDNGFLIYTTHNIVAALYTGQVTQPFTYREVKNSAGVERMCHVAASLNSGIHYAWTSNGLLQITKSEAQQIFPEITDFLSGDHAIETVIAPEASYNYQGIRNDYLYEDGTSNTGFVEWSGYVPGEEIRNTEFGSGAEAARKYHTNLRLVGNRFLCISYGKGNEYLNGHALVIDTTIKAMGKLDRDHHYIFEAPNLAAFTAVKWADLSNTKWVNLINTRWSDFYDSTYAAQVATKLIGMVWRQPTKTPDDTWVGYVSSNWVADDYAPDKVRDPVTGFNSEPNTFGLALDFPYQVHSAIAYGFVNQTRINYTSLISVEADSIYPIQMLNETDDFLNPVMCSYQFEGGEHANQIGFVDDIMNVNGSGQGQLRDVSTTSVLRSYFNNSGKDFVVLLSGAPMRLVSLEMEFEAGGTR